MSNKISYTYKIYTLYYCFWDVLFDRSIKLWHKIIYKDIFNLLFIENITILAINSPLQIIVKHINCFHSSLNFYKYTY